MADPPRALTIRPLAEINRSNVKDLKVAWSFDTGEKGGLQTNPIIVDGVLYGITPTQKIFALDAATGKLLWKFDSGVPGTQPESRPGLLERRAMTNASSPAS